MEHRDQRLPVPLAGPYDTCGRDVLERGAEEKIGEEISIDGGASEMNAACSGAVTAVKPASPHQPPAPPPAPPPPCAVRPGRSSMTGPRTPATAPHRRAYGCNGRATADGNRHRGRLRPRARA